MEVNLVLKLPEALDSSSTMLIAEQWAIFLIHCYVLLILPKFIGFDPALIAPIKKDDTSIYFPVAVSKEIADVNFNLTKNPNCSSVLYTKSGIP